MSRVSVAEGSKPKPKESFKFLRRDEGRLSYAATGTADSPSRSAGNGSEGDRAPRERRDSKSLREAIAYDMRNAKSHDPLGEVVVAVPRKAPPPNRAASTPPPSSRSSGATEMPKASQQQQQQGVRRPPASDAGKRRPEWVNPEAPPQPPARPASAARSDYDGPRGAAASSGSVPRSAGRQADEYGGAEYSRYGGHTPRRAGSNVPMARYVDAEYDDVSAAASSAADRNYFRRPVSGRENSAVSSRTREDDDLMYNLEQEIRAAQEEREHYAQAKQQLDREKQRFEAFRYNAQQQLEEAQASADGDRQRDQRGAQRDLRAMEERHRSVSALLVTEREANRRLTQENDALRSQLEDLTTTLRETQGVHKAELQRLRRDIESLTRRNAELLAMAKEQQLAALDGGAAPVGGPPRRSPQSAARERSAAHQPALTLDTEDLSTSERREAARSGNAPAVMDFTPRASAAAEAANEKRSRQMQQRMKAEEAAMEERKKLREKEAAERRQAEQAEAEKRQRAAEAAEAQEEAKRRQQQEKEKEKEKKEREAAAAAAAAKPLEERKSAGHPVNTPRVQGSATAAKRRLSASAPLPPVAPKAARNGVPTREELLGDVEPPPSEDFPGDGPVSQTALGDNPNKKETLYRSGKREIRYANGTVKAVLPSGHTTLHFTNGDVKCTFPSGKSTYWYDAAQTMHTQMPSGVQTFEFRTTGQVERHTPDGGKSILYPDGIYKVVHPDGSDETFYPDGEAMEESM